MNTLTAIAVIISMAGAFWKMAAARSAGKPELRFLHAVCLLLAAIVLELTLVLGKM